MADPEPCATLTGPAERDLVAAWRWISREGGQERADAFVREVKTKADLFARRPGAGRPQPALGADIRSYLCQPYLVYYRPSAWGLEVLRVLHSRRDRDTAWRDTGPAGA